MPKAHTPTALLKDVNQMVCKVANVAKTREKCTQDVFIHLFLPQDIIRELSHPQNIEKD